MDLDVRLYPVLVLLGLVPVAWFIVGRNAAIVALSLVSVLLIAASVYLLFGGRESDTHEPA